jgi:hypothetical protein
MRRALRRLTVGTAATSIALLLLPPAFAEGGVDLDLGDDGGSANVKVEVKDPGNGGGKSSGRGGSSSSGGKASGGGSSSSGKSSLSGGGKSSGGGGGAGTTSVSNSGRTSVGNYSSGSPSSVSSSRPDNVEILDDGSRATYYPEGAYVQGQNGGATAFVDGMTQGQPDPADPAPAAAAPDPAPQGGGEPAAPQVDPAELAQTAVSQMGLEAPEISSTPNNPDTLGAVGLPVWFWVANPGATTTGPNSTSATAGAVTVNATATFDGMTITTGDGSTIECAGPGTEYPGEGIYESPDCGHVYEQMSDDQPEGLYPAEITAHWTVTWDSNVGATGEIPVDLTTSKQLRIGSYQTVVTGVS